MVAPQQQSELEVYVGVVRLAGRFASECGRVSKKASWIAKGFDLIAPNLADEDRIRIPMDESMAPVFQAIFELARASKDFADGQRTEIAKHVCSQIPKVGVIPNKEDILAGTAKRIMLDLRGFFGDAYTALVYSRVIRAGYDCEFVATSKTGKRPDLVSHEAKVYIECKDSLSDVGVERSDLDAARKFQDLVRDGATHFRDIDPKHEYSHLIAVDLPEGLVTRLKNTGEPDRERFWRDMFNLSYHTSCGTRIVRKSIIDHPARVLISDFDFGVFADKDGGNWPREPLWLSPQFQTSETLVFQPFLDQFFQFEGGGLDPIENAPR